MNERLRPGPSTRLEEQKAIVVMAGVGLNAVRGSVIQDPATTRSCLQPLIDEIAYQIGLIREPPGVLAEDDVALSEAIFAVLAQTKTPASNDTERIEVLTEMNKWLALYAEKLDPRAAGRGRLPILIERLRRTREVMHIQAFRQS